MEDKQENKGEELLPEPEQPIMDDDEVEHNIWSKDPDNLVVQPTDTTPPDGEKIIVDKDLVTKQDIPEPADKELFGENIEEGKVPDISAKFVKVEDGRTKVIDMKDMLDHIGKSSTMDRDKAVSIESIFGGFFDEIYNIPEMYSKMPSKIGYEKAIRYMKDRISKEEAELVDTSNAFITLAYDNVTSLAEKMNNEVVPDILTLLRDLQMSNAKIVRQVFDPRDTLPMLDQDNNEVDISVLNIDRPMEYHLAINNDHVPLLNKALNAFNSYMKTPELAHFLLNRLDGEPVPYKEPSHLRLDSSLPSLYLNYMSYLAELDMYKVYSYIFSDEFNKSVDSLKYIFTEASNTYKKLSDLTEPFKLGHDSLDFEKLNSFIVENAETIKLTNAKVNYACKLLGDLPQLFSIVEDLLTHLRYVFQ